MKGDRPDLPLTIARLVRSATPVTPLARPSVRLAGWVIASTALVLVSVAALGVRPDVAAQMTNGWFGARATATLAVGVSAATVAFLMSVPGVEPPRLARALPLAACLAWGAMLLLGALAAARPPLYQLLQGTPHPSCVLLIVATAVAPGVLLARMLRQAAPLQTAWTGALAGLASLAAGALGAQFVCTSDAAAHQLLWHFAPVVLLAPGGIAAGTPLPGRRDPLKYSTGRTDYTGDDTW